MDCKDDMKAPNSNNHKYQTGPMIDKTQVQFVRIM